METREYRERKRFRLRAGRTERAHRQTRRVARVRLELLLYYNTTLRAIVTKNERQIVLVLVFSKTVPFCV